MTIQTQTNQTKQTKQTMQQKIVCGHIPLDRNVTSSEFTLATKSEDGVYVIIFSEYFNVAPIVTATCQVPLSEPHSIGVNIVATTQQQVQIITRSTATQNAGDTEFSFIAVGMVDNI